MRLHPSRRNLFLFAESKRDGRPISAAIARHVAGCERCARETAGMEASLAFTSEARALEPSSALTASILAAGRQEREAARRRRIGRRAAMGLCRGLAFAAGMAAMCAGAVRVALLEPADGGAETVRGAAASAAEWAGEAGPASQEAVRKATWEIEELAAALDETPAVAASPTERLHWRAATMLSDDLSLAMSALERNPGCARASRLVDLSLQRQADTLRRLYVERAL